MKNMTIQGINHILKSDVLKMFYRRGFTSLTQYIANDSVYPI